MSADTIHATTVAIDGRGVLIVGPSGSGKSDLALRLIDRGAVLVADDRTVLRVEGGAVLASAPATLVGSLEVRGLGIVALPHLAEVAVAMCVELARDVDRLPPPRTRSLLEIVVAEMVIDPRPASAPLLVELMLAQPGAVVA